MEGIPPFPHYIKGILETSLEMEELKNYSLAFEAKVVEKVGGSKFQIYAQS